MKNLNINAINVVEISTTEKMDNSGGGSLTKKDIIVSNQPQPFEPPFLPKAPNLGDIL